MGGVTNLFPIVLTAGDNGQLGVDLYNWASDYYLSTGMGTVLLQSNQEIFVDFNDNKTLISFLISPSHQYGDAIRLHTDGDYIMGWLYADGSVIKYDN